MLEIRRQHATLSVAEQLRELLHDAEEVLLGEPFFKRMDRMQRVVFAKYGVPWWTRNNKALHKRADILAAASEAIHVAGWSRDEPWTMPARATSRN